MRPKAPSKKHTNVYFHQEVQELEQQISEHEWDHEYQEMLKKQDKRFVLR
jgi:hypothetical protein